MDIARYRGDDDASACRLGDIVTQSPRDHIEGQRAVDKSLDKLQAAHRHLPIGADGSVDLAGGDIHAGSIADRGRLVWRLSDLIISSRNGRTHHRAADK